MQSYGFDYLLGTMEMRPPPPDPVAELVELALDHAALDLVDAVIKALDALEADETDLEGEEDGGSLYPEDTGLAISEYVPVRGECRCCGHSHVDDPILIA